MRGWDEGGKKEEIKLVKVIILTNMIYLILIICLSFYISQILILVFTCHAEASCIEGDMQCLNTHTHPHSFCQDSASALNSLTQLLLIPPVSSPSGLIE